MDRFMNKSKQLKHVEVMCPSIAVTPQVTGELRNRQLNPGKVIILPRQSATEVLQNKAGKNVGLGCVA